MPANRWKRLRRAFDRLVDSAADEWTHLVACEFPDQPDLQADLHAMLQADQAAAGQASRLSAQAPLVLDGLVQASERSEDDSWVGRTLGTWKIVRPIARGGMGRVYLAEREDSGFRHQAALKLLNTRHSDSVRDRFVAERQILADLVHPNIARLLDGGNSASTGPWFALEYVEGLPLSAWCDSRGLDVRQRLALFMDVCAAVSHAHERLVIHRDLKPANILVDNDGVVKLLDFGIAKVIDADGGLTGTSLRIFTPEYAAPEQVRGEQATTGFDVYSLGVILHELLSGRAPYRMSTDSGLAFEYASVHLLPTRPSSVVLDDDQCSGGSGAIERARRRSMTPSGLQGLLRGDLDAIVLKALRKEPELRYPTVRELAQDIEAWLQHRPVGARRGGWKYVAQRFVRRNLFATAMAAVAIVALAGGLIAALIQANEARTQRDLALSEAAKSGQALGFMKRLFENADPGSSGRGDLTVRDLLDEGVRSIRFELADQNEARVDMLLAMATALLGIRQNEQAKALIDQADSLVDDDDRVATARIVLLECEYFLSVQDGNECIRRSVAIEKRLDPRQPGEAGLIARLVGARLPGYWNTSEYEQLVEEGTRSLDLWDQSADTLLDRVNSVSLVATALGRLGRHEEASALMEPLVDELRMSPNPQPRILALALGWQAATLVAPEQAQRKMEVAREALAAIESVYGTDHPANLNYMNNLAVALLATGGRSEAIDLLERCVTVRRQSFPIEHPLTSLSMGRLGRVLAMDGRGADAKAILDEAIDLYSTQDSTGAFAIDLAWRAALLLIAGQLDEAAADIDRAVVIADTLALSPGLKDVLFLHAVRLTVRMAEGEWPEDRRCSEAKALAERIEQGDPSALVVPLGDFLAGWACPATPHPRVERQAALARLREAVGADDFRHHLGQRLADSRDGR